MRVLRINRVDCLCAELRLKLETLAYQHKSSPVTPVLCEQIRDTMEEVLEEYLKETKPEDQN